MVLLGEKLDGGPVDRSAGMLGIVSGSLFLGSSRVHPTLLMVSKRLPRTGLLSHSILKPKADTHRMYAQEQFVIHTARITNV
jgi:hypothetical protein